MSERYTAIDSFCGAGGLSYGLQQAGFEIVAAFDADSKAVETFQENVSPHAFLARAEALSGRSLLKNAGLKERLDLFAGGPPCQGFSKQKRGAHLGDERNLLVVEFSRLVREIRPRFFLVENVDQLGQKRGRQFVEHIHAHLKDYLLYPYFYNSADYGLAQTRGRFIIVGKHQDVKAPFHIPRATVSRWLTVGETLAGLPEPPEDYSEDPDYPNHYRAKVTQANIDRFSYVPQGGGGRISLKNFDFPATKMWISPLAAGQTYMAGFVLMDKLPRSPEDLIASREVVMAIRYKTVLLHLVRLHDCKGFLTRFGSMVRARTFVIRLAMPSLLHSREQ